MKEAMSEREFLMHWMSHLDQYLDQDYLDAKLESFLTEFHKEYYEVEFVKIKLNETDWKFDDPNKPDLLVVDEGGRVLGVLEE